VPTGLLQDEAVRFASEHPRVTPFLAGKNVRRVIYVPGKILNLVI
jgi:leucyl-tRNA synthetase